VGRFLRHSVHQCWRERRCCVCVEVTNAERTTAGGDGEGVEESVVLRVSVVSSVSTRLLPEAQRALVGYRRLCSAISYKDRGRL